MTGEREPACRRLLEGLKRGRKLSRGEWRLLLTEPSRERMEYAASLALEIRDQVYGKRVFVRGLIEFTNHCRNDCYYCGIRRGNAKAVRYRLTKKEILDCCRAGWDLGFRTFVLQGGEDGWWSGERLTDLIGAIKNQYPDCAVTLSVGEWEREDYRAFREAGADRYLLRHETADLAHYRKLHPENLSLKHRMDCLFWLKELGFQTGAGMMVGSPGQTVESLIDDLEFLRKLQPEMVGIGPFLPQKDTPFGGEPAGSVELTLYLLSLIRLLLPEALLPATTALGTAAGDGRERGILAGANVVMPNLSPENVREKYRLYDNKICAGREAAEHLDQLKASMSSIGYAVDTDRGDHKSYQKTGRRDGQT